MKQNKRKSDAETAVPKLKKGDAKAIASASSPAVELKVVDKSPTAASANQSDAAAKNASKRQSVNATATYTLAASCTVRDSIALKNDLLKLLTDARPVIFDVSAVDRIDTAAMQVLYAFMRDRKARGGEVSWKGYTEEFCVAARLLGMQSALGISSMTASPVATSAAANAGGASV